ncbi:MAG: hypothetical protein PHP34_08750 [Bacteroidales bacterium]|nr:hypothetical protein [Bacteroidales bacterium]
MKKLSSLLFFAVLFLMSPSHVGAQIRVNININSQPQWGPEDYDYVEYYYLPEVDIYYYTPSAQFIYRHGNRWVYTYKLPYQYRNLNLYSTYKVVINEPRPYLRHNYYLSHYKGYKNSHSKQGNIRDSRDPRYKNGNRNQGHSGNRVVNNTQNRNVQPGSAIHNQVGQQPMNRNARGNKGQKEKGNKGNKGNKNDHR